MWREPWDYKEGFTIAIVLVVLGFIMELIIGNNSVRLPSWPTNFIILIFFIAYLVYTANFVKHHIIRFFSTTAAAISSTVVFTALILIMGFVPQDETRIPDFVARLGIGNIKSSYAYLFSSLYLITVLGFTIVKRLKNFNLRNIAFFLNHAGLWIILATASLGSSDMVRLRMQIDEGQTAMVAMDQYSNQYQLPFGIQLLDFKLTEYPPNLILYSSKDGKPVYEKEKGLEEVEEGKSFNVEGWTVTIDEFLPMAKMKEDLFYKDTTLGATHAAYITAIKDTDTVKGWISPGNAFFKIIYLPLGDQYDITMTYPMAKEYESEVKIFIMPEGEVRKEKISVNKPIKVKGYKIYQSGYDDVMGRWSFISGFELIRDPWLPVVYTGFFMVLLGALYLLWTGKKQS